MTKIALSASYWNLPVIKRVLGECETVYTTNVDKRDEIREELGFCRVKFIPFGSESMFNFLKSNHPGAEFITFGDLRNIIRRSLIDNDIETARLLADYCGWDIKPKILYDEECIEGEEWVNRHTGKGHTCFAGEAPRAVTEYMKSCF